MQKRVYSDENRWCTCFCWMHLFGWNNKRNPWSGAAIQMEMNPVRCVCVCDVHSSGAQKSEEIMRVACLIILCLQGEGDLSCTLLIEGHENWQSRYTTEHSTQGSQFSLKPQDKQPLPKNINKVMSFQSHFQLTLEQIFIHPLNIYGGIKQPHM